MRKIFILAPGGGMTGGPELLHQLGDVLNRDVRRAWVVYVPFDRHYEVPAPYRRYNVGPAPLQDVGPESIIVVPEIYTTLLGRLPKAEIYFWWQSVDNFVAHAGYTVLGHLIGAERAANRQVRKLRRNVAQHMYQSEYAREFLQSVSLGPTVRVSDYLADEYIQAIANPPETQRADILVYNPAKGEQQTAAILRALKDDSDGPMPHVVPLEGMTRDQVRDLLGRAKVYIDFGGHPGKDRIPREAVALGACILVNRRGSAANPVDIPIPIDFKIEDDRPDFEWRAAKSIKLLMRDFEQQAPRFDAYRQVIAREPADFLDNVLSVFR